MRAFHANITRITLLLLSLSCLFSCRKVFDRAGWAPDATFPVAYTELSIQDIITDSSQVKSDKDGLISLVYRQKLDSLSLNVLDTFSAPPFYRNFKLDSLRLEVEPFVWRYTLGALARELITSGQDPFLGTIILSLHGRKVSSLGSLVPPSLNLPPQTIPISLNQFFERADLRAGNVELSITNRLPLKVEDLSFLIRNASSADPLISESGINIEPNASFVKNYDLAGKTVEGNLLINLTNLILITDREAVLDTNSAIDIQMKFSNLQVTSATAVFPDQDVVTDRQAVALEDMGELELREAIIEEGSIVMDVVSTIQDSIFMTYSMPKTTQNGVPLLFNGVVPPATATTNSVVRLEVPIREYVFNLSTAPDYYNRFLYDFKASVKRGKKVYLNLQDSIVVNVYLKRVRPKYVRGYLGRLDTTISSSVQTDAFSKINVQSFSLEKVNLKLHVENGLGVGGKVTLESLKASNANNEVVVANDPALIGPTFSIASASNPPFLPGYSTFSSSNGSNFASLVSILPTKLDYTVKATVGGGEKDSNNFVFNTSKLKPELQIEVPLIASIQGLVLRDTIAINPSALTFETNGGALKLLATNKFPFSASIKATFVTASNTRVVLLGVGQMQAATINLASDRVTTPKQSKIELPASDGELQTIATAKYVILEAVFHTPPGDKVKIYSDYSANLTLTAKVAPKISR